MRPLENGHALHWRAAQLSGGWMSDTGDVRPHLGFIGLGNMGAPIAERLQKAAGKLAVYDVRADRIDALVALGAESRESPAAVAADCQIVFTCLPGPSEVAEVYLGGRGLGEALHPGSLCIDMTTVDGDTSKRVESAILAAGGSFLAAPVTNGVRNAQAGQLTLFLAGTTEAYQAAESWLLAFAEKLHYLGSDVTRAAAAKLVTNLLWFVHAAAIGEAMCLALKCGIPRDEIGSILVDSVADSWVARNDVPSIRAGHYDPSFSLGLCCKDLRLVRELAVAHNVPLPVGERVEERFRLACETFGADGAELLVARLIESASGAFFSEPNE